MGARAAAEWQHSLCLTTSPGSLLPVVSARLAEVRRCQPPLRPQLLAAWHPGHSSLCGRQRRRCVPALEARLRSTWAAGLRSLKVSTALPADERNRHLHPVPCSACPAAHSAAEVALPSAICPPAGDALLNCGRIAAATGAALLCENAFARLDRGAGLPDVQHLPYFPQVGEWQVPAQAYE